MVERRAAMCEYILAHGQASVEELRALFPEKSVVTIRRDLAILEDSGAIIRSHGGARANVHAPGHLEPFYNIREGENTSAKARIAELAVSFIEERRALYIDSGTTTMAFAQRLPDKNLTIVTSAPNIALHVAAKKPSCSTVLTGGSINRNTLSCSGFGSTEILQALNFDIAFMGASGFSAQAGFTAGEHFECDLKHIVLAKASRVILLMDSSKIGQNMPFTFAQPEEIHILITDTGLPRDIEALLTAKGVRVVKAER